MLLQLGAGGTLLLGPDGKLAVDPDCCCGGVGCCFGTSCETRTTCDDCISDGGVCFPSAPTCSPNPCGGGDLGACCLFDPACSPFCPNGCIDGTTQTVCDFLSGSWGSFSECASSCPSSAFSICCGGLCCDPFASPNPKCCPYEFGDFCCASDHECCNGTCCDTGAGQFCCNPFEQCCHAGQTCDPILGCI